MISLAAREREAETHFLERNATELASGPHPIKLFQPSFRVAECLDEIKECLEKAGPGLASRRGKSKRRGRTTRAMNTPTLSRQPLSDCTSR